MDSEASSVAQRKTRGRATTARLGKNQKLPNIGDVFNPYGMFNGIWVPESLLKCPDLCASAKLLYGRLARFAGNDGRCFPSCETLADELGMTARQVQRLIGQLCKTGFLRKEAQYRPDGSQTSNAYFFLYHASLAPAMPAVERVHCSTQQYGKYHAEAGGDKNVTPDKSVTPGVTVAPSHKDSQSNSTIVNSSSSSTESTDRSQSAADPDPSRYPLSTARFREFFPRTTEPVIVRILRAIFAACPDCSDDDIAAAVNVQRDQNSPGLWLHTMPGSVQKIMQRRISNSGRAPKCLLCGDSGVVWDALNSVAWCPATCQSAVAQKHLNPDFVDEWNAYRVEKLAARVVSASQIVVNPSEAGQETT